MGYPATRDAIEAVADESGLQRALTRMTNRCLLTVGPGEAGREYRQHDTLRSFYYELLGKRECRPMHRRAGEYYKREPEERDMMKAARHFYAAAEFERSAELAADEPWLLINQGQARALGQLLEQLVVQQMDAELQAKVYIACGQVHTFLGRSDLAKSSYKEALDRLETLPDSPSVRTYRARVCLGMSTLLEFELPEEALDWAQRGLRQVEDTGTVEEALLYLRLGSILIGIGDFAAADSTLKYSLQLLPEQPPDLRADALTNLGVIQLQQGHLEEGKGLHEEALSRYLQSGNLWGEVSIRRNLGGIKDLTGDWAGAALEYQRAHELAKQLGNARDLAGVELDLSILRTKQGEWEEAATHLTRLLERVHIHSLQAEYRVAAQSSLADLHLRRGEPMAAAALLREAEQAAKDKGTRYQLPEIYRLWASVRLAGREARAALEYAGRSVDLARDMDMDSEEGIGLRVLAQALAANEQPEEAMAAFEHSVSLLAGLDRYEVARTQMEWGKALVAEGDGAQGNSLLEEARAIFRELGARQDLTATL
jgi:ATP/maltotriose-dependent transcriptional regulator MalT